jgi:phosphomannomutase
MMKSKKIKNTIILFDMDGTLTQPRQSFDKNILGNSICKLIKSGIHVGIITGSDEDYLREQMGVFINRSDLKPKIHLLPCNGTKYFKPPKSPDGDFILTHEVSMEKELGEKKYRDLICELIYSQIDICHIGAPLTGHFINCRGSTINWSPIGRNANNKQRKEFIDMDKEKKIRERVISELKAILELKDMNSKVTVKLGGDTSFDIYPKGWDKTYGLRHFQGWDIWFVGDRCGENGNDREIYEACVGQSYITESPEKTAEIIDYILNNLRSKK